jgi:hypothetical protein
MSVKKNSNLKPIVSVGEMASMINLSRARFYQLLNEGILPQPLYSLRTKRPLYTAELQQQCIDVRESNIGVNNQYILFYSTRKKDAQPRNPKKRIKTNSVHKEFAETLNSMGLDCSAKDVSASLSELYPDDIGEMDHGVVIRDLFRLLRSK